MAGFRIWQDYQYCRPGSPDGCRNVQHAEQKVYGRNRFAIEGDLSSTLVSSARATNQNVRHIEMLVLIGIAHVGAV